MFFSPNIKRWENQDTIVDKTKNPLVSQTRSRPKTRSIPKTRPKTRVNLKLRLNFLSHQKLSIFF